MHNNSNQINDPIIKINCKLNIFYDKKLYCKESIKSYHF